MKPRIFLAAPFAGVLAMATLLLSSCRKSVPTAEQAAPAASPVPTVVATPLPATPIAVATPPPDPIAPPGVYFLLQTGSITTEDGIIGLQAGQAVRYVSPGTYEVEGQMVQLRDDQVTNNLRIARQVAGAAAAAQVARRQQASSPQAAVVPSREVAALSTAPAAPPRVPVSQPNPLSGGARLGGADPEAGNRRNVKLDGSGRQYWRDSRGTMRYDF